MPSDPVTDGVELIMEVARRLSDSLPHDEGRLLFWVKLQATAEEIRQYYEDIQG